MAHAGHPTYSPAPGGSDKETPGIRVLMFSNADGLAAKMAAAINPQGDMIFEESRILENPEKAAEAFHPTVILLGVRHLEDHGLDLLRLFRKYPATLNIPVIFITPPGEAELKSRVFSLGGNDCLDENSDPAEVTARIRYHSRKYLKLRHEEHAAFSVMTQSKHTIKVLMIETSRLVCKMVARVLADEKDLVFAACQDPGQALAVADEFLPTIILQSLVLDEVDGFELLESLRSHPSTREVPIIVLSAIEDVRIKARALAGGADDYIVKSSDCIEMISRIRSHSSSYFNRLKGRFSASPEDMDQETARALMVDDSEMLCKATSHLLKSERKIVFTYCTDPLEAIDLAEKFNPTVILQDLNMPQMDGFVLLERLRETPFTRDIPIIVLSGATDSAVKAKAFALGANDYLEKKMDKIELTSRLLYHSKAYRNSIKLNDSIEQLLQTQKRLEIQSNFIRRTFGRYLSDEIVNSILETPQGLKLGGESRELTILMSDLRGFTSLSERLCAEDVLTVINNYLKVMTDILLKYGATIDEFIGDAILGIFGAPVHQADHAERAVACAIEMQLAMEAVNARNSKQGFPILEMGIGLNTGEVVVGNIGSEKRTKYGVVGQNVNLTSRIESYTVGNQILISESTFQKVAPLVKIRRQLKVEPKGIKGPITLYDVCGIQGEYNLDLSEENRLILETLDSAIPVVFYLFEDKVKGTEMYSGEISRLGRRGAALATGAQIPPFANVAIQLKDENDRLLPGEIFAKVVENTPSVPGEIAVRFTYIEKSIKSFLPMPAVAPDQ